MKLLYPPGSAILAPVAGHTDLPMRMACRQQGCRFAFTEMIDAGSLVWQTKKTCTMAVRGKEEDFLGVQLVGSDCPVLAQAAKILNDMEFDVLDFNLGCPAPKVVKKCEGITLALQKPDEALWAVETLVKNSRFPVTVKTRIHSEEDPEPTVNFCKRLQDAGAAGITIHGRVKHVFYSGPVFYSVIRAVRETLEIPVVANGGALTPEGYHTLLKETGCSCGMIARGALGNPWLFREITGAGGPPSLQELADGLESHVLAMFEFYGEELGSKIARKTILEYLRGRGFPAPLRASVSFLSGRDAFARFMEEVRKGPSPRYWEHLEKCGAEAERKLSPAVLTLPD